MSGSSATSRKKNNSSSSSGGALLGMSLSSVPSARCGMVPYAMPGMSCAQGGRKKGGRKRGDTHNTLRGRRVEGAGGAVPRAAGRRDEEQQAQRQPQQARPQPQQPTRRGQRGVALGSGRLVEQVEDAEAQGLLVVAAMNSRRKEKRQVRELFEECGGGAGLADGQLQKAAAGELEQLKQRRSPPEPPVRQEGGQPDDHDVRPEVGGAGGQVGDGGLRWGFKESPGR